MSLRLYSLVIRIYGFLIVLTSVFNHKARLWRKGRKDIWIQIEKAGRALKDPVWIHASSLGEFEQGRPVIEEIKKRNQDQHIVLTFFSPSGYEIRKNYSVVDSIFYLPLDTPNNAEKFLKKIQPSIAIFIKYDFWFNYLNELTHKDIPFFFISSIFDKHHFIFKSWAKGLRTILQKSEMIFVQDKKSHVLLTEIEIKSTVAGDNRIDRVIQLQHELNKYSSLDRQKTKKETIVFGSIWPEDVKIFSHWIMEAKDEYFFIMAPHDIGAGMQKKILAEIAVNFQKLSRNEEIESNIDGILVDTIGDLAHLYQYGKIAYVGGGFGKGIHSILEPVAAGLPVIFGPNYQKFKEARDLIQLHAALVVNTEKDFREAIKFLNTPEHYKAAQKGIDRFLQQHQGSTLKVVQYLAEGKFLK